MVATFLVVGATGNTGQGVVETLSELLKANPEFSDYKVIALTRSASGSTAQKLAKLPSVEVVEQNWVDITADWLRQHNIVRAFIAPHNEPAQFAEESAFHLAALEAGVEYVVRISTTATNVRPDCPAYYPRQHWAIEALLGSPEFEKLRWTSLQPNVFSHFYLSSAAEWIKNFRKTGKQDTLRLIASEDTPVGIIDSNDIGIVAAHLLTTADTTLHNKAKYVLNGPEDITGRQIIALVEEHTGAKVENVIFKDMSYVDAVAAGAPLFKSLILSIKDSANTVWEGNCRASTTSQEVLQLAAPRRTAAEVLKTLLDV